MTSIQQGLNDLVLAGIISATLFIIYFILSGLVNLISFIAFKIKTNSEIKKDRLRHLRLKK